MRARSVMRDGSKTSFWERHPILFNALCGAVIVAALGFLLGFSSRPSFNKEDIAWPLGIAVVGGALGFGIGAGVRAMRSR
jgi:hypothetical protein